MKLKKLELSGFKSFPEPTELAFHEGTTSIVGPNGCGKSNLIDAIRWVMGETSAKGLRGDSMEDVIFSGSDGRKPVNLAEVTLTLTQAEGYLPEKFGSFDEVSVTRRLHRSGESEYLINRVPCRLKDITELFMDTGVGRRAYSVVEQGRIDSILAAKPKDRRFLIEEAAGITKYRSRKEEALRKMEHTTQNLQRIADVIGEVRREMNALKRQATRAEAFKGLRGEKKRLERDLLVASWLDLQGRVAEARALLEARRRELEAAEVAAAGKEAGLEEGRLRFLEEERGLEARQRQVYHLRGEIGQRESRHEFLGREVRELEARSRSAEEEGRELRERVGTLGAELSSLEGELREVEERIGERERGAGDLDDAQAAAAKALREHEGALESRNRELLGLLGELTRVNHSLDHAQRQGEDVRRRLEGMERQGGEVEERLREIGGEVELREAEVREAEAATGSAGEDRLRLEVQLREARAAREEGARRVEGVRKALQDDRSRLKALEQIKESLEWYGAGVKAILRDAKQSGRNGIHGVVADTIAASSEYEAALEAALGERLQYVIVEDSGRGLDAVRQLKERRAGRSSFAPVNLREAHAPKMPRVSESWARGPLLDLVKVAPDYDRLARCLLGDVFVVETLEHALRLWESNGIRATLVTLEGETISPEGVISGGAAGSAGAGLLRKNREIRELRERVARGTAELQGLESALGEATRREEEILGLLDAAREEVHRRELRAAHLARDLAQLRERRDRLEERREAMEFERGDLAAAGDRFLEERARCEIERRELLKQQEAAEAARAESEEALRRARGVWEDIQARVTAHRVAEASDRERREGLAERVRALRTSIENVQRRAEKLAEEAAQGHRTRSARAEELHRVAAEAEALRTALVEEERGASEFAQRLEALRGTLTQEEREAAELRRAVEGARKREAEAELALRDAEMRGGNLADRYRERLGGELGAEAASGLPEGFDPAAAEGRVAALASQIEGFGEINLLAIEEYEERRTRFEFLEGQRQDLEQSLESLRQAIQRINRVSRERFAETFEKVSDTFRDLYPQLFQGGEARLLLTDPEDLLETGVDIVARPAGKRPQHISLLSGGEKALTAVALIFSIFLVKPSPFCILDEVDAPLDEANIGRFCELIRSMAGTSQFLLITHNKSTMEAADHLYGVTMSEPGVSRAVSVRLTEEKAEAA